MSFGVPHHSSLNLFHEFLKSENYKMWVFIKSCLPDFAKSSIGGEIICQNRVQKHNFISFVAKSLLFADGIFLRVQKQICKFISVCTAYSKAALW